MHPGYFETEFRLADPSPDWHAEFFIISAYATTGELWTHRENERANYALERCLRTRNCWRLPLTCFSPSSGHEEPSWACEMSFDEACIAGLTFRQDAIYHVQGDQLSVTYCDEKRALVPVGNFRDRLHLSQSFCPSVRDHAAPKRSATAICA